MKKTNVLIVDQALEFGGSIVSTANLVRGIDRSLYNVVFMSSNSEELIRNKLRELGKETDVVIARKRVHYLNSRNLFRQGRHSKIWIIRLASVSLAYTIRLMANLGYMLSVAKTIKQYDIDIVQLNNGIDDEVAFVSRLLGVKQTVYIRGHVPLSKIQRKLFLSAIGCFFSVSKYVRQDAIKDGIDPDKIVVVTPPAIPEAVDSRKIAALRQRYQIKDAETTVGIFGRVLRWKGQKQLVYAAREVVKRNPNVRFFVVGDKTDGCKDSYEELLSAIEECGLTEKVVFTGYVENVYDYYELMDVVVHASIEPEPSGRVIFEAMSQAKPVIASIFGGPQEFIEHGVDGFLVNPHQSQEFSDQIVALIQDKQLARQFGANAQEKMQRLYNKSRYARKIETVYQQILSGESKESVYEV